MTVICLRERSSRTTSLKRSGTIGRSAMRHFLYLASYSSGSASCTRCPTAHVTTCGVGLEVALVLGERARERLGQVPPDGRLLGDDECLPHCGGVRVAAITRVQGQSTRPSERASALRAARTIALGTPKPPRGPEVVAAKTVVTTWPSASTIGPPELPDRTAPRSDVIERRTGPCP